MPEFARTADLLICEGMYYDDEMRISMQEKMHMLFSDAASIARAAAADKLWLTHFSPACTDPEAGETLAKSIFDHSHVPHDGEWITL